MGQLLEHLAGETGDVLLLGKHHDGLHDGQDGDEQRGVARLTASHHGPVEQRRHSDDEKY